ncbi:MAG: TolC family protein, partial [Phocaeicola sp.]
MKCLRGNKMIVALLAFCTVGVASLQAQDTLCITLDQAVQIAIADNPTIKVANQEIEIKKVAS